MGDLDPHVTHGSFGPPASIQPKRHLDQFSRFCRAHDRDRQTDRQTTFITIGRIYVHIVLRSRLIIIFYQNENTNNFVVVT